MKTDGWAARMRPGLYYNELNLIARRGRARCQKATRVTKDRTSYRAESTNGYTTTRDLTPQQG